MTRENRISMLFASLALMISIATAVTVFDGRMRPKSVVMGFGAGAPSSPFDPGPLTRVMFPQVTPDGSSHSNEMISLAHNWDWSPDDGWSRRSLDGPSAALTMESWYHGFAELNYDMRPPRALADWPGGRALGFAARYDGSYATLLLGGQPYNEEAAGIKLTGGLTRQPILSIFESPVTETVLQVRRPDGTPSLIIHGGVAPALALGVGGAAANSLNEGIVRVAGSLGRDPVLNVVDTDASGIVLSTRTGQADSAPRLRVHSDGRFEWADPAGGTIALVPSSGSLEVNGVLKASALRVGNKTTVRHFRVFELVLSPEAVSAGGVLTQDFDVPGLSAGSFLITNGPSQPYGIVLSGAQTVGSQRVSLTFMNNDATEQQPAPGRYQILAIEAVADADE